MNHIYVYNQLLNDKMNRLVELSKQSKSSNSCIKCKKQFENKYKIKNLTISESNIHELDIHQVINYDLYEQIMKFEILEYNINYNLFNTNELNVIDGLYEEGSYDIYIDKKKNIFNSKDNNKSGSFVL